MSVLLRPSVAVVARRHSAGGSSVVARAEDDDDDGRPRITRENEPKEAWGSNYEREGGNPLKDPVVLIGLVVFFFPFVALVVAFATGAIDIDKANAYYN